jgi:cytochrome P450
MSQATTYGSQVTLEELERDPYPIYKRLRDEAAVVYVDAVSLWLATRWDDVNAIDKTPELFTGETDPSTLNRTFGKNLLGSEGEYHARIRSIIYPAFRVGAIGHYPDEVIAPIANELIDAFVGRGEVEFVAEFAEPLSTKVVKRTLGLGDIDDDTLRRWFVELAAGAANFEGDPTKQAIADKASQEVNETIQPILDRLESEPDDTVLSNMLHSEVDGQRLTRGEIQSNLKVMIVGGLQAGTDLIALSLWALLSHREQADEVKANPELVNQAIEEGARWHSPVGTSTRQTTRDTELDGVKLEKGALVAAVLASANRDERHWTNPDRFDIRRREGAHLAFATGPHLCLGARLGRYEARTSWRILFERLPNLRLDPDRPIEISGWEFRSPHHLHLLFDA